MLKNLMLFNNPPLSIRGVLFTGGCMFRSMIANKRFTRMARIAQRLQADIHGFIAQPGQRVLNALALFNQTRSEASLDALEIEILYYDCHILDSDNEFTECPYCFSQEAVSYSGIVTCLNCYYCEE